MAHRNLKASMNVIEVLNETPMYVLISGEDRIGPARVSSSDGTPALVIYGFSDKGPYESFRSKSTLALRPYPLVKRYLQNQITGENSDEAPNAITRLVVLDALGPDEPTIDAATMEAVLAAHENKAVQIRATHRLSFDPQSKSYRL